MIKVLIVDDEILIRVGIKSCIDWEANGYEVIGLAGDGNQALEIIRNEQPDIVLTDIKMPGMDGLELIEKIKEKYARIRVIVLSCYNELDFIKKAMKLGADDYILKLSMQPEDLLNALNSLKDMIHEKNTFIPAMGDAGDIRFNKSYIKEDLYKRAIDNAITGERLVSELKKLGYEIPISAARIIRAGIDDYSNASVRSRMEDQYLLKFSVINIIEEILSGYCAGDIVETEKGKFLIIFTFRGEAYEFNKKLEEFFFSINNALRNYLNITVSFGVSDLWIEPRNFSIRSRQAERALEQRFYFGKESIIFYETKMDISDKPMLFDSDNEKKLTGCLESFDEEGAKKILAGFFNSIHNIKEYHPSKIRMAVVEIFHSFIKVAKKFDVEAELQQLASKDNTNPIDILMKSETAFDIEIWFSEVIEKFIDCLSSKRLSIERPEIIKLKKYISDRIYEEITLDEAAKVANMNRSYLSSVFKKETGISFTDYVNSLKIEEAKGLIQKYGLRTCEAAEKLGFRDESYFSKLFKKYVGVNPSKVGRSDI